MARPASPLNEEARLRANEFRRTAWNKMAPTYDRRIGFVERYFGPEHRSWICSQAEGDVLEVAIGTGLNIPLYPDEVRLTGIELSPEMLVIARRRAADIGRDIDLQEGDAQALPFPDASFDTVVCTYSLCNIPDEGLAVAEMKRVVRPGGKLLLLDHIRSSITPVYWVQRAIEFVTVRMDGDHMTRRPLAQVKALGFDVVARERSKAGIVERIVAVKPEND